MEVIEIEKRPDCSEIQAYLRELTGASSVPRVFIGGKCIGGGDDTEALDKTGQLQPLLQQSGAV
jgi:glutaredoxin 3